MTDTNREDAPDDYHVEYVEGSEAARLVVETDRVTVTVEGEPPEVRRQFEAYQAAALGISPEELGDLEEYPMPPPDELDSVPADEFYDE